MPYFNKVAKFCFFIATERSGHSIVGHLLTAHPEVLISDELNALSFIKEGFSAEQVYALIKCQDSRLQKRKRKKSGYSYWVDGTWQNVKDKHPVLLSAMQKDQEASAFFQRIKLL